MKIFTVNAFTDRPFTGNPAGVCILNQELPEDLYLRIAREINYSETAFVLKMDEKYLIRWFTPKVEVNLCGHATLAAAHIIYELGLSIRTGPLIFESKSGLLRAQAKAGMIELDFPQLFVEETSSNALLESAFDIKPVYIGKNENRYLIEIADYTKLIHLKPDFHLLESLDLGRFILTTRSVTAEFDFVSRYFAPGVGVPEDPVTGTAHCYLAPYWGKKLGRTRLTGFQASERSGFIRCELADNDRVLLQSQAVTMFELIPTKDLLG